MLDKNDKTLLIKAISEGKIKIARDMIENLNIFKAELKEEIIRHNGYVIRFNAKKVNLNQNWRKIFEIMYKKAFKRCDLHSCDRIKQMMENNNETIVIPKEPGKEGVVFHDIQKVSGGYALIMSEWAYDSL